MKLSELQEDLPAMCTQDIYEEDAELDCDLPAFWFDMSYFAVPFCCVNSNDFLYEKLLS